MKVAHLPRHPLTIPITIYWSRDLNALDKLILAEIIWLQDYDKDKRGYAYPQNTYFRAVFNISNRQVSKIISKIANLGYIKVTQQDGLRKISYNYSKCYERDIELHLKPKQTT